MGFKYAFYRMEKNEYLHECFAIVCDVGKDFEKYHLTRNEIIVFVKPSHKAFHEINTLDSFIHYDDLFLEKSPVLRIGSECMFGMFGDSHCQCESERISMLRLINESFGVYVHLPQEAQGMGLFYKAQELHLQVSGIMPDGEYCGQQSQDKAAEKLTGNKIIDNREYLIVPSILHELNLAQYKYRLASKNPNKSNALKENNIIIQESVDISTIVTATNIGEHLAKWWHKGYEISNNELESIIELMCSDEELPPRAVNIFNEIRFSLQTKKEKAFDNIYVPNPQLYDRFVKALTTSTNPSINGGGKLQLWSLLERADAYEEFQHEYVLTDEVEKYLQKKVRPDGELRLWHEINHYFYLPYSASQGQRDLKIRLTYDMWDKFLQVRLIHKIQLSTNTFEIRSINFSDPAMFELLRETVFKDYDQEIVECITFPYSFSNKGIKVIVKHYANQLRTISLEGNKQEIVMWCYDAEESIGKKFTPVVKNPRSFAPRVLPNQRFDARKLIQEEFDKCRRYFYE